jgi:hypothetical protein
MTQIQKLYVGGRAEIGTKNAFNRKGVSVKKTTAKKPVRSKPKGKPKGGKGKSASKSTISKVMKAAKDARNVGLAGSSLPNTFSDLMKEEKKSQVKYDRGADFKKYLEKARPYQEGLDAGAKVVEGPDGIERLQFSGLDKPVYDEEGRQILSMQLPNVNAKGPSGMELLRDMGRTFSGYNELSYDPDAVGTPSTTGGTIVRNEGLGQYLMPGKISMELLKNLGTGVRDYFSPNPNMGDLSYLPLTTTEKKAMARTPSYRAQQNQNTPDPVSFRQNTNEPDPVAPDPDPGNTDPDPQQTVDTTDLITFFNPQLGRYVTGTYQDYLPFAQVKDGGIMNAAAGKFVSAGNAMKDTIIDAIRRSVANGKMSPEAGERAIRQIELGPQPKQQDLFKYEGGIIQNFANGDEVSVPDLNMFNPSGTNRVANPGGMPYMDRETDENLSMEDLAEDRAAMKDLAPESGITKLLDRLQTEADIASDVNESREFMNTPEPLYKNVLDTRTGQLKRVDVNDPGVRESIMKRELIPFEEGMPAPRMEDIDFKDPQGRGDYNLEEPIYRMQEGMPEDLQQMKPFMLNPTPDYTDRPITGIDTPDTRMLEAAEGGIIGLGHGGMSNPMDMQAMDGMMFKDPEDGEEWEYNV